MHQQRKCEARGSNGIRDCEAIGRSWESEAGRRSECSIIRRCYWGRREWIGVGGRRGVSRSS